MLSARLATVFLLIRCFGPTFSEMELPPQNHTNQRQEAGCEFEVVQVTDTTLRGRGVDQDTRGFHHLTEVSNAFWLVIPVSVLRQEV